MKKENPRLRAAGKKTPKASKNEKFVKPADDDLKQYWKTGNMLYPVPAVMVSCKGKEEGDADNIVTVAWAGTICSDPAMVSISVRPDRYSHDLIEKSGEFVINLVTRSLTNACDWCGVRSGRDFDKFAETGLHKYKSEYMDTPAIAESPVNIYCKVVKIERLGSHDMFLAEVVGVTVSKEYLDEHDKFHLASTGLVAYVHGEYFALGARVGTFGYSVKNRSKKLEQKKAAAKKPTAAKNPTAKKKPKKVVVNKNATRKAAGKKSNRNNSGASSFAGGNWDSRKRGGTKRKAEY